MVGVVGEGASAGIHQALRRGLPLEAESKRRDWKGMDGVASILEEG